MAKTNKTRDMIMISALSSHFQKDQILSVACRHLGKSGICVFLFADDSHVCEYENSDNLLKIFLTVK